jgi:hypothetical protein
MKLIVIQTIIIIIIISCGKNSGNNTTVQPEVNIEKNTPGECQYNDKVYKIGERFQSIDQCNTCECSKESTVSCTTKSCN